MLCASRSQLLKLLLMLVPIFSSREETSLPASFFDVQSALDARQRNYPPKVYYRKKLNLHGEYGSFIFVVDDNEAQWSPVHFGTGFKLIRPGYETETISLLLLNVVDIKVTGPWFKWEAKYHQNFAKGEVEFCSNASLLKYKNDKGTEDFAKERYIEVAVYPTDSKE
ncbi:hypothetical protein ENBRE01_1303 [Enteropsectra breve]|nr:hypothetical protein ENBRE01_1303 [Enteropsectra breve]